MTFLQ